jgi:molybdopterin molybdotransferase
MTGAPVPRGADTVIRVEYTQGSGSRVGVLRPEELGSNIRRRGEELKQGDGILRPGTVCGAGEIAVLEAQQRAFAPVYRRPVVAVLSTGDELVDVDEPLAPGKVVNSNTYGLAAMVRAHGGAPVLLPIARDRREDIRRAIESALTADFILSSGGVSVGEYDYVKQVLDEMGAQAALWRVAMKPGKPLFFCTLQGKPYFGLPGNPVSSLVSFLQFVRPAIRKAIGHPEGDLLLPTARAATESPLDNPGDRRHYLRAHLRFDQGRLGARVLARQGSHMLSSMLGANGLVVLEPGQRVESGGEVTVQIIGRVF